VSLSVVDGDLRYVCMTAQRREQLGRGFLSLPVSGVSLFVGGRSLEAAEACDYRGPEGNSRWNGLCGSRRRGS
jgi:hypothetical protein